MIRTDTVARAVVSDSDLNQPIKLKPMRSEVIKHTTLHTLYETKVKLSGLSKTSAASSETDNRVTSSTVFRSPSRVSWRENDESEEFVVQARSAQLETFDDVDQWTSNEAESSSDIKESSEEKSGTDQSRSTLVNTRRRNLNVRGSKSSNLLINLLAMRKAQQLKKPAAATHECESETSSQIFELKKSLFQFSIRQPTPPEPISEMKEDLCETTPKKVNEMGSVSYSETSESVGSYEPQLQSISNDTSSMMYDGDDTVLSTNSFSMEKIPENKVMLELVSG